MLLTPSQRDFYADNGYILVPGVLGAADMEAVRRAIAAAVDRQADQLLAGGAIGDRFADSPFERRLADLYRGRKRDAAIWNAEVFGPEVYDLLVHPALLDVVESLIGPEITVNGDYWVRPKLPGETSTTYAWHQDSAYYGAGSEAVPILSVWIPLVDVDTCNGCLQVLAGSHKWGLMPARHDEALGQLVPAEEIESRAETHTLPMKAGDVLVFGQLTYHKSLMNRSDSIRWSIDLRYSPTGAPLDWFFKRWPGFVARSRQGDCPEPFEVWAARRAAV